MTETQTNPETQTDPVATAELEEMADRLARNTRWTMIGVSIAVLACLVAAVSLGLWAKNVSADGARNSWDDMNRVHITCEAQALTRADTISLEHDRYDREAAAIDDDEATVDLIEANVMGLIAYAQLDPSSEIVTNSVTNIAVRRERVESRRGELAAARADFDVKRPPLDPAACPPAPNGPRP